MARDDAVAGPNETGGVGLCRDLLGGLELEPSSFEGPALEGGSRRPVASPSGRRPIDAEHVRSTSAMESANACACSVSCTGIGNGSSANMVSMQSLLRNGTALTAL